MYSFIEGKIVEINPTYVVIETGGIGFHIEISLHTFEKLNHLTTARIYTHLLIKSEGTTPSGFALYGFAEKEERKVFILLTSVSGVGNNTARLILSSLSAEEVKSAIVNGNVTLLQKIKGIGEKTAQRIIVDLKDKVAKEGFIKELVSFADTNIRDEALSALVALGVNKNVAEKAIDKVLKSDKSTFTVEELIKQGLKNL